MILVRVKYRAPEGKREEFVQQLFDEGLPQACRAEEGCISYDYYYSVEDPNEVLLLECWKNESAIMAHGNEPHFNRITEVKAENGIKSIIERFDAKQSK
ncbi:MAG: antibiotic biosynthesis monooxygenase [Clostridia bacterium]|nr:antibiotic biosynthesis monooxygenase [Clostridia bacterium]